MKLFVNDEEVTIHNGAKVFDVMRGYYMARNKKLPRKLPIVTDAYGNSVAPDGALSEGNHLYIKTKKQTHNENNNNITKANLRYCSAWNYTFDKLWHKPQCKSS